METFPAAYDKDSKAIYAFEIENAYVSLATVAALLGSVDGVRDVQRRKPFGEWGDIHIRFKYLEHDCVVVEPFGDNSRYWIGAREPEKEKVDISKIEGQFREYSLPFVRRLFGDILSLRVPGWLLPRSNRKSS